MRQNIILKYMIVIVFIAAQLLIVVTLRPAAAAGVAVRTKAPSTVSAIPIDTIVTYTHDLNGNRISESSYIQPPSTTTGVVIGAGVDSLDAGGIDTFVRNEAGQVGVVEVSSEGVVVGAIWLTYNGGAATVDTASSIVGTGVNLLGDGNHNAFLRLGRPSRGLGHQHVGRHRCRSPADAWWRAVPGRSRFSRNSVRNGRRDASARFHNAIWNW